MAEDGEGGSACHCHCVPSHHFWVFPCPREGTADLPLSTLEHILIQIVGLATLVGTVYRAQDCLGPPDPRSCSSCVKHSSWGLLCVWSHPFYHNTEFLLYNTHQDTIVERVLVQPPILCPDHTLRLLILGSQIGTKDSRVGCCS